MLAEMTVGDLEAAVLARVYFLGLLEHQLNDWEPGLTRAMCPSAAPLARCHSLPRQSRIWSAVLIQQTRSPYGPQLSALTETP